MNFKHIVAVHGIGDQKKNEFVIGFLNEFVRAFPPEIRATVKIHNLVNSPGDPAFIELVDRGQRYTIAFSEVYWQPVTNRAKPPVPVFTWAHSVSTRMFKDEGQNRLAREAIDNLERMLGLLRRLAAIYKKSKELVRVLEKFIGDVQIYVEDRGRRAEINQVFLDVLATDEAVCRAVAARAGGDCASGEIYVVAHSEGTVVSYNSLVEAAAAREGDPSLYDWLPRVRGLVTLGSPLDKHYRIWDNRFRTDRLKRCTDARIPWYNYWDQSDPVGMNLDVLTKPVNNDAQRLFDIRFDRGFARYPIPGKAHVDYFDDPEIHLDILQKVMQIGPPRTEEVESRWWGRGWIMVPGDWLAWALGRAATATVLLACTAKVVSPLHAYAGFFHRPHEVPTLAAWAGYLSLLLLLDGLFPLPATRRGRILRAGSLVLFFVAGGLSVHRFDEPQGMLLKDWFGYAGGLVVASLIWQLHTTVHRGLVQMWRYTTKW